MPSPTVPTTVTPATPSRLRLALTALVLAAVTVALYARTGGHGFVGIDDDSYVLQNEHVTEGLTAEGIGWAFTRAHSSNWHPLTWMSHMLDVELFGVAAGPAHLVSATLHALGAALLFLALVALTRRYGPSLVVAGLFAVHPTHVESVAWISERKDVLSGVFFMGTLLAYAYYVRRPSGGRYAAVFAALAMGLMAKPMLVTMPFVLLLLDAWPLGRWKPGESGSWRRLVLEKLPLFALVLASAVTTSLVQSASGSTRSFDAVPMGARVANAAASYLHYLRMNVWPRGLAAFYPHPATVHPETLGGLYLTAGLAAVVLAGVTWYAWRGRGRKPFVLVGWLWFLGTLVPVIGLLQVGNQAFADRYLYLPSIGLFVAVVWLLADLPLLLSRPRLGSGLAAAALAAFAATAWFQIGTWHDTRTLFTHANAVTADNYLAYTTLGTYSYGRDELERARGEFEEALRIDPTYIDALNNLGPTLMRLGLRDEGMARMREAVRVAPTHPDARANLGLALQQEGVELLARNELDRARAAFEEAVQWNPGLAQAHVNLGGIAVVREEWDRAARHLRDALAIDPNLVGALYNMGLVLVQRGETGKARQHFERVLQLAPQHGGARAQRQALSGR